MAFAVADALMSGEPSTWRRHHNDHDDNVDGDDDDNDNDNDDVIIL